MLLAVNHLESLQGDDVTRRFKKTLCQMSQDEIPELSCPHYLITLYHVSLGTVRVAASMHIT